MRFRLLVILALIVTLCACREERISDDPSLRLTFSTDTLSFDTVFTSMGSATLRFTVYNYNANAVLINRIWQDSGNEFKTNIDGENDLSRAIDRQLNGGDSLIVFVKVFIDPTKQNAAVLVEDNLHFALNGNVQTVHLEAFGQDVRLFKTPKRLTVLNEMEFNADKPYLIYDTLAVRNKTTFKAGAKLYFHNDAVLLAYGDVEAQGTLTEPVMLRGDRIDNLYDSVSYAYVAGMWGGLYLMDEQSAPQKTYKLDYMDITSANVGLFCVSDKSAGLPKMTLTNSRIHNHAIYGLVLQHIDATVANCEISNAAAYCVYLSGGKQRFVHSTIASFFNSTNVRIQSTPREDVAAVYINNVSKNQIPTHATFINSIVTGVRRNNLLLATPLPRFYEDTFACNYLKADTVFIPAAIGNIYWQEDDTTALFRNTYYKYKEYSYYDFRLDSLSPARAIADSVTALSYPFDRYGRPRIRFQEGDTIYPDAGCYQY